MIDNGTRYVIRSNGMITEERTVISNTVPLKEFFDNVSQLAPRNITTPPLPLNTVRYAKESGMHGGHIVTMFHPSKIMTIFYKHIGSRERATPYNLAFPHLLFKMAFSSAQTITAVKVAVIKERPTRLQDRLYFLKMPNIYNTSDLICMTPSTIPGDIADSCTKTLDEFFTGQSFNEDLAQWPDGIDDFLDWQTKTTNNPRFIENIEWNYMCTFGEWTAKRDTSNGN